MTIHGIRKICFFLVLTLVSDTAGGSTSHGRRLHHLDCLERAFGRMTLAAFLDLAATVFSLQGAQARFYAMMAWPGINEQHYLKRSHGNMGDRRKQYFRRGERWNHFAFRWPGLEIDE